ncbi:hypothetical protein FXB39_03020 [Nocardioides sp. BGMRC 2183]|nr:hypothetical protein FXB39_03020 [Nocardioides sp. BGMRC 2183]
MINVPAHNNWALFPQGGSDGDVETGEIDLNIGMTTCHELGHAVGLVHHGLDWYRDHDNDCMRSPWLEAEQADAGWRKYNQHHVNDINSWSY